MFLASLILLSNLIIFVSRMTVHSGVLTSSSCPRYNDIALYPTLSTTTLPSKAHSTTCASRPRKDSINSLIFQCRLQLQLFGHTIISMVDFDSHAPSPATAVVIFEHSSRTDFEHCSSVEASLSATRESEWVLSGEDSLRWDSSVPSDRFKYGKKNRRQKSGDIFFIKSCE